MAALPILGIALSLGGCGVATVATSAAGAAISVTSSVVSTGVELTGKAVGAGVDALTADKKPTAPAAPATPAPAAPAADTRPTAPAAVQPSAAAAPQEADLWGEEVQPGESVVVTPLGTPLVAVSTIDETAAALPPTP